jgi:hypothetical protein
VEYDAPSSTYCTVYIGRGAITKVLFKSRPRTRMTGSDVLKYILLIVVPAAAFVLSHCPVEKPLR